LYKKVFLTLSFFAGLILFPAAKLFSQTDSLSKKQTYYYPNGSIASSGELVNGKPNGIWETFYPNGMVRSKGEWKNGELNGYWEFFDSNGDIEKTLSYLNGKKHGLSVEYQKAYLKGKYITVKKLEELFENGSRVGKGFYFSKSGYLEKIIPFENDKYHGTGYTFRSDSVVKEISYYRNGKLVDIEEVNRVDSSGLKHGKWVELYNNFEVNEVTEYKHGEKHGWNRIFAKNGDVIYQVYYLSGQIEESKNDSSFDFLEYTDSLGVERKGTFFGDTPVGIHVEILDGIPGECYEYSLTGKIVGKGKCQQNGKKENFWIAYFENGTIKSKGNYSNGIKNGAWNFFYPNGNLEQEGVYQNGKEHGKWNWFYNNGQLKKVENYYYGILEGDYFEYDSLGNTIVKGYFSESKEDGEWEVRIGDIVWKGFYIFGELSGKINSYYTDGSKYFEGEFLNGYQVGKHRYYYPNGILKEEQIWESGVPSGTWKKYNTDGTQAITITYRNGKEYLINGIRLKY